MAAGVTGIQGSQAIRFDRDFPKKSGGIFGSTNLNYQDYYCDTGHAIFPDVNNDGTN